MPTGYQITQFEYPIVGEGVVTIDLEDGSTKDIRIERMHIEQDAGKSIHDIDPHKTFIDLNRAGVGLMEIVTNRILVLPKKPALFEETAFNPALSRYLRRQYGRRINAL